MAFKNDQSLYIVWFGMQKYVPNLLQVLTRKVYG